MNFVAEDWIEREAPSGTVSADNNPPTLPSDCAKVMSRQSSSTVPTKTHV